MMNSYTVNTFGDKWKDLLIPPSNPSNHGFDIGISAPIIRLKEIYFNTILIKKTSFKKIYG